MFTLPEKWQNHWKSLKWRWKRRWWKLKTPGEVQKYYDKHTGTYLATYGRIIQSLRPTSDESLLDILSDGIDLRDGLKMLDAGCGVCGPAIALAGRFNIKIDGVTVSKVQVKEARKAIEDADLANRVKVKRGDFHQLTSYFKPASYDRVCFLESLGYANAPQTAIKEAYLALKPGGKLYIKDYFPVVPMNADQKKKIRVSLDELKEDYFYNTLDLEDVIHALRHCGFRFELMRRPSFQPDYSKAWSYEKELGIANLDVTMTFDFEPYEWLEIRCLKPHFSNDNP